MSILLPSMLHLSGTRTICTSFKATAATELERLHLCL